jgi:hypothetical protein
VTLSAAIYFLAGYPPLRMTDMESGAEWRGLTTDREIIGFSRQITDRVCVVVKLPGFDLPFYFAEHLQEDNVMRFGVRGFDFTDFSRPQAQRTTFERSGIRQSDRRSKHQAPRGRKAGLCDCWTAHGNGTTLSPNAFQSNRMLDESRAVAVDRVVVPALSTIDRSNVRASR